MGVKRPRAKPAPVQPVAQLYPSGSIFYPSMDDYFAIEARLRATEARNIQLRNFLNVFFGDRQDLHQFFEPTEQLIWYYCESLHFWNSALLLYMTFSSEIIKFYSLERETIEKCMIFEYSMLLDFQE